VVELGKEALQVRRVREGHKEIEVLQGKKARKEIGAMLDQEGKVDLQVKRDLLVSRAQEVQLVMLGQEGTLDLRGKKDPQVLKVLGGTLDLKGQLVR
jgi:hypothetical protein